MLDQNLVLIGGGNMGTALLRGILKAKLTAPQRITVVDVHAGKLAERTMQLQCTIQEGQVWYGSATAAVQMEIVLLNMAAITND